MVLDVLVLTGVFNLTVLAMLVYWDMKVNNCILPHTRVLQI